MPAHEVVQAAHLRDEVRAGAHGEVVGVGEQDLGPELAQGRGQDTLHRGLGSHRHEDRRGDVAVRGVQDARARVGAGVLGDDVILEQAGIHGFLRSRGRLARRTTRSGARTVLAAEGAAAELAADLVVLLASPMVETMTHPTQNGPASLGRRAEPMWIFGCAYSSETRVDEGDEGVQSLLLVGAVAGNLDLGASAEAGGQDHHDGLGVDGSGVLVNVLDGDVALILLGLGHEDGRGTGVKTGGVDDARLLRNHAKTSFPEFPTAGEKRASQKPGTYRSKHARNHARDVRRGCKVGGMSGIDGRFRRRLAAK